jgi:ABC-type nitrate/sulfonate/bicarbonate transport system ATPase subunit
LAGIELRHISQTFGGARPVPVLDDVSLTVAPGEFATIVGPSGCGKSTLLRILAGLLAPSIGQALVDGRDAVGHPGLVAYMPQKDLLFPWRRALANATLGAEVAGVTKGEAKARARELLPRFGLEGFERAWPSQLSGGMRQRLALLRTFLIPSRTMLLDEPFGALDAITRREMHSWLQDVLREPETGDRERGTGDGEQGTGNEEHRTATGRERPGGEAEHSGQRTVLFITHDVEEALVLSDAVYVMSPRPGRMAAKVDVPFARPRPPGIVVTPEFVALKARLLSALEGA